MCWLTMLCLAYLGWTHISRRELKLGGVYGNDSTEFFIYLALKINIFLIFNYECSILIFLIHPYTHQYIFIKIISIRF